MNPWICRFVSGVALLAISIVAPAKAQEFNWTNASGDNNWFNEINWNAGGDGFPGGGSDVNVNGGVGKLIYTAPGSTTNPTTLDLAPGAVFDLELGTIGFPGNSSENPYSFQNSGVINVFSTAELELRDVSRNFSTATINVIDGGILNVHADGAVINTSNLNNGNGTINLSNFHPPSDDSSITGALGASLFFQKQTISGFGDIGDNQIGLTFDADTIVDANFAIVGDEEMTIDAHNTLGIVNQGVMKASNGGLLHFEDNSIIANAGGIIEALADSEVVVDAGFNISGGTLRQVGNGVFGITGSGSLADIVLDGPTVTVLNANRLNLDGTIHNGGLIATNSSTTASDIAIQNSATLVGGGTIRLSGTGAVNRILDFQGSDGVLTNVNNTIEGQGGLGLNLLQVINQSDGVIDGNDTAGAGALTLDPRSAEPMVNRGLYTASNGGTLSLTGGTFDNVDGVIEPLDGSFVTFSSSVRIVGGTLRNVGTGDFISSGGAIEDVTIEGVFNIQNGRSLGLDGTIDNLGEITTNSSTTSSDLVVQTAASLTGGGTVTLGGTGIVNRILDFQGVDGVLTNVDNTIQGKGSVGVNLLQVINETDGTIGGSDPSGSLTLDPPNLLPMINRGLYTAFGGGDLMLSTGDFDNTAGLIQPGSMSTVTINLGAKVTGGLLIADDDSAIRFAGSAVISDAVLQSIGSGGFQSISGLPTLSDSTLESTISVGNAAGLGLDGTIHNSGLIVTNSSTTASDIAIQNSATLVGGGTIRLSGTGAVNRILDFQGSDGVLTNVDNTIEGQGRLGLNLLQVINQSDGVIDGNDTAGAGALTLDPRSAEPMVNRGLYTASNGGTLSLTGGTFDNVDGVIEPQDGSFVTFSSSARIVGGTLRNVGTGDYISSGGTIEDATIEGVFNIQNGRSLGLEGTINNLGEITTNSSTTSSDVFVQAAASLTGGGTVTLGGTGIVNRILDFQGSDGVLTNVDNTIQGHGRIGLNTLQFVNEVDGTVHANVSSTLMIDPPGVNPTVNEGTLKASNGGTLSFIGALENGVEGTLTGDSVISATGGILNLGTVAPGNSPGQLTINADLTLGATSSLEIEIESVTMADLLDVNGSVELDGELKVSFLNGFQPDSNDTIDILIADSLTGAFANAANGAQIETADGKGIVTVNYVGGTVRLSNFVLFTMGQSVSVTRGTLAGGSVAELELSDNLDLSIRRANTDIVSRTEFELQGVSPLASPASMSVVLEGSVFARTNVTQRIELFNFLTNAWEVVDSRGASRFVDRSTTIVLSGDLSRFIDQSTLDIAARVRFTSGNPRQRFTSNTDQFIWIIQ